MGSSPRMAAPWRHPKTGTFYFRRAVPEALRATIGVREIKVSLHTRNPSEAKQRFVPEAARCEALFAKASADQMTPERAQQLAEAWRHRIRDDDRSEEHTSELQSLMRISYAGFCLKKTNKQTKAEEYLQHTI